MINRELHEAFGHCWHEIDPKQHIAPNPQPCAGFYTYYKCIKCHKQYHNKEKFVESNPDYKADPRLVIREMEKREGFGDFLDVLGGEGDNLSGPILIPLDLIIDSTGKLATIARDWIRKQKGEICEGNK